ncbi:glycosyltransferase family 4 protein [Chloroflexota bacterium]
MTKVCIVTSFHNALDIRIFYKQARTLARTGYQVILIAQHATNETRDGVTIKALPIPSNIISRLLFTTWHVFFKALREKADVYHFHDDELLLIGFLLKLITRSKVIYDVHEDYSQTILEKSSCPFILRRLWSSTFNLAEKQISRIFDHIVTATDHIANKFNGGAVTAITNYPLVEMIKPQNNTISKNPSLIYAGQLTEIRGVSEIVQAMAFIDSSERVRLSLYGNYNPRSLRYRVCKLMGFEKVDYCGWINQEQIWLKMAQSFAGVICIHPVGNHICSMPNKLFEYMAAGIPVIASNFPLWKEIIEGNKCGVTVDPLKPKEIARAIDYLIRNPLKALKMGENARKAVIEKYNWQKESEKLLAIYDSWFNTPKYTH